MTRACEKALIFGDSPKKNLTRLELDEIPKIIIRNPRSIPKTWRNFMISTMFPGVIVE